MPCNVWPGQCYTHWFWGTASAGVRDLRRQGKQYLLTGGSCDSVNCPEVPAVLCSFQSDRRRSFFPDLKTSHLSTFHPSSTQRITCTHAIDRLSPSRTTRFCTMDFLDKLKQGVEEGSEGTHQKTAHSTNTAAAAHEHEAEPPRDFLSKLIAGSGPHHASAEDDKKPEKLSLLDRLTHKEAREKKAVALAAREAELKAELEKVAHDKKQNEGFFERLKDRFDGGDADEESQPATTHDAVPKQEAHHASAASGFFDKLTGKEERERRAAELDRKEVELRAELERVEHEKRDNEGLLQRLKDHLDGDEGEDGNAATGDKPSFLDKITGKAAEEERLRKEEENKTALEKMKDRLDEQMGGGRKAEEKEDLLDKSKIYLSFHYLPLAFAWFTQLFTNHGRSHR